MEHLSKSLLILSEKIKTLLASYSDLAKENEILKNRIFLLENDISSLHYSLEEKKKILNEKDEDSIFIVMLIDELLENISNFNYRKNNFCLIGGDSFEKVVSFDCQKNIDELANLQ